MKKIFILAVSAVLLVAGCQKTEIQNEARTPIGFSSQIGKLTKAVASSTPNAENAGQFDNLYQQSFKVWGYFATEGDINYAKNELYLGGVNVFGDKTEAVGEDGKPVDMFTWHTSDTYYWPGKDKELDLYAISSWENADQGYALTLVDTEHPTNNITIDPVTRTVTVKDFVVKSSADNDLMVAPMIRQDQDDDKYVRPEFKHMLTKVVLKFKKSGDYPIHVISAKTSPVYSTATLTVDNTLPAETPASGAIKCTIAPRWSTFTESSPKTEYVAEYDNKEEVTATDANGQAQKYNAVELTKDTDNNPVAITFGSWLLLPQPSLEGYYFEIEYIVAGQYMSQTLKLDSNVTVTAWGMNQSTIYNVTIYPDFIEFDPEVTDWSVANTQNDNFFN